MKASELIQKLQAMVDEHGDLDVHYGPNIYADNYDQPACIAEKGRSIDLLSEQKECFIIS